MSKRVKLISTQEAGRMRWQGKTKAERSAHAKMMVTARQAKRQAEKAAGAK